MSTGQNLLGSLMKGNGRPPVILQGTTGEAASLLLLLTCRARCAGREAAHIHKTEESQLPEAKIPQACAHLCMYEENVGCSQRHDRKPALPCCPCGCGFLLPCPSAVLKSNGIFIINAMPCALRHLYDVPATTFLLYCIHFAKAKYAIQFQTAYCSFYCSFFKQSS